MLFSTESFLENEILKENEKKLICEELIDGEIEEIWSNLKLFRFNP